MTTFDFEYDDSDLTAAINEQVNKAVKDDRTKDSGQGGKQRNKEDNTNAGAGKKSLSTQEVLDGSDDLEGFFKTLTGDDDIDRNKYYLEDDDDDDEENGAIDDDDEFEDESEEDTDDKSEDNTDDDLDDEEYDDDEVDNLLEIIRQEQLLYIPEDFEGELDARTLDQLKQQTRQIQRQEILAEIRNQYANDPDALDEFDYFITGGRNSDLSKYRQIKEQVKNYQNFDISTEDNQRMILRDFLKDGLDPNNPAHSLRLNKLEHDVDDIIDSMEGEQRAEEAQNYFINKYTSLQQAEDNRVAQLRQQELFYEQQRKYQAELWHNDFQKSLQERVWNQQKKQAVLQEQYSEVQMEDGSYAPVWYAKEVAIKSDPQLYQIYLDWLSSNFDLEKGEFINIDETDTKTKVTRKILDMVNKKRSNKSRSQSRTPNKKRRVDTPKVTSQDLLY